MDTIVYFLTALLVVGLPLNLMVFWSLRCGRMRSGLNNRGRQSCTTTSHCKSTQLLRSHINLADLIIMCGFLTIKIVSKFGLSLSLLNSVTCKVVGFVNVFGFYLSSNVVACIAIDRVLCTWNLSQPAILLAIKRHQFLRMCGLPAAWILAVICSTPHLVIYDLFQSRFANQTKFNPVCTDNHQHGQPTEVTYAINETNVAEYAVSWYHIGHTIVIFPLPCLIMIGCYSYVITKLYKNREEMKRQQRVREMMWTIKRGLSASDLLTPTTPATSQRSEVFTSRVRYTYIYMKSTATVISYILCWSPYYITTFTVNHTWLSLLYYLTVVNSVVNPIIFLVNSRQTSNIPKSLRKKNGCLITRNQNGRRYGTILKVATPLLSKSARPKKSIISFSENLAIDNRNQHSGSIMLHVIEKPIDEERGDRVSCFNGLVDDIAPEN